MPSQRHFSQSCQKDRVKEEPGSRSTRVSRPLQVGGREFVPVATHLPKQCPWRDGFADGTPYPYLTDSDEARHALQQQKERARQAAVLQRVFVPAVGGSHLCDAPTVKMEGEMLDKLAAVVSADWVGIKVRALVGHLPLLEQAALEGAQANGHATNARWMV